MREALGSIPASKKKRQKKKNLPQEVGLLEDHQVMGCSLDGTDTLSREEET
jgi:hypothetical protein